MTRSTNPFMASIEGVEALFAPGSERMVASYLELAHQTVQASDFREAAAAASSDNFWPEAGSWMERYRPYVVKDGILQIPVKGVLMNEFPYALGSWATGYEYIWQAFKRGCADYAVGAIKGIALVCNTPGGMVAGCFDTVDRMTALKEKIGVPVAGFAHESAYSAGYALISLVDKGQIYVSRTGGVGSIGVVTSHVDMSKLMDDIGYAITFIYAGAHKVDGNPYEPLPDDVKARIQERIDEIYGIFVSTVARNRGLTEQAVRDTEALTFTASTATKNGLADKIGSFEEAIAAFAADLSTDEGDETMSTKDNAADTKPAEATAENKAVDITAQLTAARQEGAVAERERISAILGCDEAQGRSKLASHLAFKTTMSVEDSKPMLAEAAQEVVAKAEVEQTAGAPKGMLDAAMGNTETPVIGAGSEAANDPDDASATLELAKSFGVRGLK